MAIRSRSLGPLLAAAILATASLAAAQCREHHDSDPLAGRSILETRANTFTYQRQMDQSLDVDAKGRVLVAWGSRRQEHGTFGVFAQLFDPLGRPLGSELHGNEFILGNQMEPAVAFGPDGSAWVAWYSVPAQDGHSGGVYMRRFADIELEGEGGEPRARFQAVSDEILVNETTTGDQMEPALVVGELGGVLVAWSSDHAGERVVMARRFDAFGVPLGGEFRLSESKGISETRPVLAALGGGRAVAVWSATAPGAAPGGLRARLLDAAGFASEVFAVHEEDGLQHVEPSVDADAQGHFVVAWMSAGGAADWAVTSRRFAADGTPLGAAARAARPAEGMVSGASVAVHPGGRYVVAYNLFLGKEERRGDRPRQLVDVMAHIHAADGTPQGAPFRVNRSDSGKQTLQVGLNSRHVAWSARDQIAVAWHGRIADDGGAAALTLLVPEELDEPAPPPVEPVAVTFDRADMDAAKTAYPEWDPNWRPERSAAPPPPAGPDFGFQAFAATGWNPPDPDLAVGPNHVVAVVNVDMRFFDKQGNQQFNTALESFFGTSGFVFDPVALYDHFDNRFVIACSEHAGSTDYFDFAVSDDDDPNGTWHKYRVDVNSLCGFIDFENLGVTKDTYSVIADCFSGGGNYLHIIDKASVLNGGTLSKNSRQLNGSTSSTGAVRNYDANLDVVYGVSSYAAGSPHLRIYGYTDPNGSAVKNQFDLNVGSFSSPPDAQQQGSSSLLDTIDHRVKNAVVRDGMIYISHAVNGGDGASKVRWYKVDLNGWPASGSNPSLVDSGEVDDGNNVDTWFADVNVDASGNMALAYNRSSSNQYVGVYRTFRLANDPAGTVRASTEMQISDRPDTSGRWGDYSGLEEDPAAPGTFWSHTEYRLSSWRTWVGQFVVSENLVLELPPLFRGTNVAVTVSGAQPGETVHFGYSLAGTGSGPCYASLGGLCVDLLAPVQIAGTAVAGATGGASITVTVPSSAPLIPVHCQAVIQRGAGGVDSIKSNVDSETIQ